MNAGLPLFPWPPRLPILSRPANFHLVSLDVHPADEEPMPTVLRSGPYRFFFYAGDRVEPPHVHVEREGNRAKFWLDPVRLQESGGFSRIELNRIAALVDDHRDKLIGAWNEYFND